MVVCSWNVQTLVESFGDPCIRRKRQGQRGGEASSLGGVNTKLDLLVRELKGYEISIAGIQETKWFGK